MITQKDRKIISRREKNNNKQRIFPLILTLFFMFAVSELAIVLTIHKTKDISELENRKLATMPQFTVSSLLSGDFTSQFETFIQDQFPARDLWIKSKAKIDILLGKNKINDVYLGSNGYLIEDFQKGSEESLKEKSDVINKFADKNDKLNFAFMLVPTAGAVVENELPQDAPYDDQHEFIKYVQNNLNEKIKFVDVYDTFKHNKNEKLYYKTDHHWTTKGAFIAYKKMCSELDMEAYEDYDIKTVADNFLGSLYYKMGAGIGDPESIQIYIPRENEDVVVNYVDEKIKSASLYSSEKLKGKDKYEVFTNGNHSLINIKTQGDNKKKLLIIKDSYANSFLPFLTQNYGEINVVDLRYNTDNVQDIIESYGITDVLFLFNVNTFNEDTSILNLEY